MKKIILLFLVILPIISKPCTEDLIIGDYTKDGRPIHWKVRMWFGMNRLLYWENDTNNDGIADSDYDKNGIPDEFPFLGVRSNNNIHPNYENPMMGLNSAGLSIGITIVGIATKGNTDPLMTYPLCHLKNVEEYYQFLKTCPGIYDDEYQMTKVSNNYGVMDRKGNCVEFEYEKISDQTCYVRIYDATDNKRKEQMKDVGNMYGFVSRANEFWGNKNSEDFPNFKTYKFGRCYESCSKLAELKKDKISIFELLQGKNPVIRRTSISEPSSNCSTMIIQGVKPNEEPRLSVFWVIMGHSDYSIAVHVWILGVQEDKNKLPPHNLTTDIEDENFAHNVDILMDNENYERVQELTLPFESKIFEQVDSLFLPRWRKMDWSNQNQVDIIGKEMNRFQNRTSADAFSLIRFLNYPYRDYISLENLAYSGTINLIYDFLSKKENHTSIKTSEKSVKITLDDHKYKSFTIDYGDNTITKKLNHKYEKSGEYLISVTFELKFEVTFTEWFLVTI